MNQTIEGVLIGILTSLFVGVFLLWQGNRCISFIRRLPTKWRAAIMTDAYYLALTSYPYSFVHMAGLVAFFFLTVFLFLLLIVLTFSAFNAPPLDLSEVEQHKENIRFIKRIFDHIMTSIFYNRWSFLVMTLLFVWVSSRVCLRILPVELIVPFAHRDLVRIKECVAKCGTKKQFLDYSEAEDNARTAEDIRKLMLLAKEAIKSVDPSLADRIIDQVSTDLGEKDQ